MRFNNMKLSFAILVYTSVFFGCTEKLPLSPTYSIDTDWTPAISIYQNGYQRVEVLVDRPTRKQLWRNISYLTLQARKSQLSSYDDIDTLKGTYAAPADNYYINQAPIYFLSKPRLEFDADYTLRFSVRFGTGETHYSNALAIKTPREVGKVLKRINPGELYYVPFQFFLSFWRGSLLLLKSGEVIQVDTASGQQVSLKTDFHSPNGGGSYFRTFTVLGDSAFSFYSDSYDGSRVRLVSLNLSTLHVDSSITVSAPGQGLSALLAHRGELFGLWWSQGNQQFGVINPRTGEIIRWFSESPSSGMSPWGISSDGTCVFYSTSNTFDNRIIAFDPVSARTVQENRNPVYSSTGLAWDGSNFWVFDDETQTFAKLKLDGMQQAIYAFP